MSRDSSSPLVVHALGHGAISTDEAMAILNVSRATAQRRLRELVACGRLARAGAGRGARYVLPGARWERPLRGLAEDRLWSEVRPTLADLGLSGQELATVGYTFTEMVNNAIDHSGGTVLLVTAVVSAAGVLVDIADDGIGVFRHVRESLHLPEDVEAVFVLEKGRFTTQPARHTGEGIFFSAKAANRYRLESGRVAWITDNDARDTTIELLVEPRTGTRVCMQFAPGPLTFDRTRTTVRLATFGVQLLSRSEARRITTGLERFRHVTVDFTGVDLVGQGFCDEVFRVFAAAHAHVTLHPVGMSESVAFMVHRAGRSPRP